MVNSSIEITEPVDIKFYWDNFNPQDTELWIDGVKQDMVYPETIYSPSFDMGGLKIKDIKVLT